MTAMLTSPCSPPLFARYTEVLARASTKHGVEIRDALLVGLGNVSDIEPRIDTMNGTVAFCGVLIELAEKGRFDSSRF